GRVAWVVAVEVDGVAAGEVLLETDLLRDLAVDALDHRAVAVREEVLELLRMEQPRWRRHPVPAPQRRREVVEPGAPVLVVLERPQDGARGDDPERQPGEHRPGRECAVVTLERAAVELGDRPDPGEARGIVERRRTGILWSAAEEVGRRGVEVFGRQRRD